MNIQGISKVNEVYSANKTTSVKGKTKVEMPKDSLAISNISKDYSIAAKAVKEVPDIRKDIVENVKQQIALGNYNFTGEEILSNTQKHMFNSKI